MTVDEAKEIGHILSTADGGCPVCTELLLQQFHAAFPQFHITMTDEEIMVIPEWPDGDADYAQSNGRVCTVEMING